MISALKGLLNVGESPDNSSLKLISKFIATRTASSPLSVLGMASILCISTDPLLSREMAPVSIDSEVDSIEVAVN